MKPQYKPKSRWEKIGWLIEECGEVLAPAGKSVRYGLESFNPELPEDERETNRAWLLREIKDLKEAIRVVERDLAKP